MLSFAIVVPNLNQSHFLPDALESLRNQTRPFNLGIMDGGSSDDFDKVVNRYSDIITFFHSAEDHGQAAAIKEGKKKLPGDIVAWLNADDYYFPETLDKVAACFDQHPELDVIYGDAIHVSPEGFFLSYFPSIQEFSANDLTRNCFICQPACFVRRTAYEKVRGVDPALHYTMDWDLWCRLSDSGAKFYYLNEPLAAVRYYHGTKTLSGNWKRYLEIWRIERKYGHRFFPRSWLGFYLFDLNFRNRKNLFEKFSFVLLNYLRLLKNRLVNKNDLRKDSIKKNYGFQSWKSLVEGKGTIHIPWYGTKEWSRLILKLYPPNDRYRIKINGRECEKVLYRNGHHIMDLPKLENPHRLISIESLEINHWKLLEFYWEV